MSDAHGPARNEVVSEGRGAPPLALAIGRGVPAVLSFAGQGERWWTELAELAEDSSARDVIDLAERTLTRFARRPEPMSSGLYHRGTDISRWLAHLESQPDEGYLASAAISMPMIFLTQALRLESLMTRGLGALASQSDAPFAFATGYSQGVAAAAYASERMRGPSKARLESYFAFMCALGFEAASGTRDAFGDDATGVMVALIGPLRPELDAALSKVGGDVVIALENDRKRHVISGDPAAIAKVIALLEAHKKRQTEARQKGHHGGRILEVAAEPIAASAAFHHPKLAVSADRAVETSGFSIDPKNLSCPVIDPATGAAITADSSDPAGLARAIAHSILARSGRWQRTLLAHVAPLRGPTAVLDLGPGDGIARVTAGALRGANALVIPMSDVNRREDVFHAPAARLFREAGLIDHRELMPSLIEIDGRPFIDNRYTRHSGTSPVLLPGMTPTTVDVPIVAAAANAGYWSELAGGGQVSEKIFRERMRELQETLSPGAEIVFNALLLDSYLWNLHLGKERLVQRARAAGAPICGVVVSAGIPDVESATALLDELHALGMTLNAFKPGTRAQIDQVIAIAKATRHTIYIHVEGGKAGGHHSWEDLEDLLLERYWHIRQCDNLILCVGGGIATEQRAVELLDGRWSLRHGQLPMPVDAIFLGTLAMACREATATPGVKDALAQATGTPAWVGRSVVDGGITSGRSQLDADIHYLENAAARCGRLLDEVAGDADKVAARRDEIIAALNVTAKPYFGDFADMSWGQIIERMIDLMAIGGQSPRYEDGPFLDVTWRTRLFDVMRRAEARLAGEEGLEGALDPIVAELSDLDEPRAALAHLTSRYPKLHNAKPHPIDVPWFLRQVCTRPGKPVPFVPVIDQDVRRYYKSDSLWQAQDPRYPADAVLVIPGPEAVSGIAKSNEPVADLLSRFEHAVIQSLGQNLAPSASQPAKTPTTPVAPLGTTITSVDGGLLVTATDHHDSDWLAWVAARYEGPLAALLATPNLHSNTTRLDNLVRKMIVRHPGATLRLTAEGRRLTKVEHTHPQDPGQVVLTLADKTITLTTSVGAYDPSRPDFALTLNAVRSMGGRGSHYAFLLAEGAFERAVAELYGRVLFPHPSAPIFPVAPFAVATEHLSPTLHTLKTYRRAVAHAKPHAEVPPGQVFSLAWPAIYRTLSCDELVSGLLRLVHLDNQVERLAPLVAEHPIEVAARVSRIEDHAEHRIVRVEATLSQSGQVAARLVSGFHIRGAFGHTAFSRRTHERFTATLSTPSAAERELVAAVLGLDPATLSHASQTHLTAETTESRPRTGPATYTADGTLYLDHQEVRFSRQWSGEDRHPLTTLAELLDATSRRPTPMKTLASQNDFAPAAMDAFALAGGDLNPIHRSLFIARLAGLAAPIAHGMWTAGRLVGLVADRVLNGDLSRIARSTARFLAPLLPGEAVALDVVRESVSHGQTRVTARAFALRDTERVAVASVELDLAPEKTAYVFPGQGIQHRDMGMSALSRSPAARQVWERADRHCRNTLGFSILEVVRDNPLELEVGKTTRERLFHPDGVIHLTQLTQVAMAVLAYAQVAELEEAHVWSADAIVCGHSVGEYNAISAGLKVLPLESVVAIVYQRGCVMHGLVPRDAEGRSGYAMGVVRPHYAKLDHAGAERLVAEVRQQTGGFIEIVNYNVKGRQYSVTGEVRALAALAKVLQSRQAPGSKPAWIEVPGIDVPFHSSRLKDGVADFRAGLDRYLPPAEQIDPDVLIGRYIPNLVAKPFVLTREFVTSVRDAVLGASRDQLDQVLSDFERASTDRHTLTRLLLIELLAWQFASPVRWIETQDLLFANDGVTSVAKVDRIIEVGVGTQPTLANMARQTAALTSNTAVQITNVEAERAAVYAEDLDLDLDEPTSESVAAQTVAARSVAARFIAPGPADSAAAPDSVAARFIAPTPTPEPVAAPESVAARFIAPTPPTTSTAPTDRPLDVATALTALLSIQAKVRPDQVGPSDTIDGLFDGVSSRRNQVLMDLGAEFECGSIDRAHEISVSELAAEVTRRAPRYKAPGAYLSKAIDEAAKKALAKAGLSSRDLASRLESAFGFGPGLASHALVTMSTATRTGPSARGGELTTVTPPTTKADADTFLDALVAELGKSKSLSGLTLGRLGAASASSGGVVDLAAVAAIEDRLFGKDGVLAKAADALHPRPAIPAPQTPDTSALDNLTAELGEDFIKLVAPRFDAKRHVVFASSWASAQRNLVAAIFDRLNDRIDDATFAQRLGSLAPHAGTPRIAATANFFAAKLPASAHTARQTLLALTAPAPTPTLAPAQLFDTVESRELAGPDGALARATLNDLTGKTALVTGAGPGSIAVAMVERLLQAGARVVVTTSSYDRRRLAFYRELYDRWAAPGAELHVVPFNAASLQDTDALVDWLLRQETEQAGATTRVIKPVMRPDLVVPFAALKDLGTADQLGAAAEATLRAMVIGTERLVATLGKKMADASTQTHVVLPLSPNHGAFGGDGAYAESKAALEVMLAKWTSERAAWARGTTMVGARIGWVRGTGLMAANDGVADGLTAATGIRTYSNEEMAALLLALCGRPVRELAKTSAILADLSGGFARVPDLKGAVDEVRKNLENQDKLKRRREALEHDLDTRLHPKREKKPLFALPSWPLTPAPEADLAMDWPAMSARPEDLIVIVGYGEISPGGSARTRFELEVGDRLSAPAVLELAWMCGLVRYEEAGKGGTWVDVATNEPVAEHELAEKYHDVVRARVGVRPIEPKIAGFDAERAPVLEKIYLERDFTFPVGSEDEAKAFLESSPDHTRIAERDGAWTVTRLAGSEVRVPREVKLSRRVGGQLPTGFDLGRFGVPSEMLQNVDRIALMNLVATVESFVSAGTSPEELLSFVHPARVGTTQGSGMGGMRSLHRLYVDHLLGRERQSDMLQETLINVVFAYATSAYVGSYGPMAHPVAACATAALSIEDACDKIMVGKADVVMAGGWDDISEEGFVGFGDMNATAPTDKMLSLGLEPDQFSRANDRRRKGFVESQGGGSLLIARGDVARDMGLPVYGVVAYAGSFGDGINRSIPAPGIGSLAAAVGGQRSPLARALKKLGLTADDIAVVSKHDTSTNANDPNESLIHQTLMDTLARTPGNPLMVHSQKTVLGHSKGGAAAWQSIMLCQMLAAGVIPGNKNLESVDPALMAHDHLLYMNRTVRPGRAFPLRAGVLTSLGFGHVSALCVIAHPAAFVASLPEDERQTWLTRQAERQSIAKSRWAKILLGQATLYEKRGERRFASPDGTDAQRLEETAMLLDPDHRLVGEVFSRPTQSTRNEA